MYARRFTLRGIAMATIGTIVLVGIVIGIQAIAGAYTGNDRQVTIHVTDKERVCDGGKTGDCKYLVYADEGTFKDVDSILNSKYNSSDIYGALKRDHTYVVHVEGFRSGPMSEYPNIIEIISEVETQSP